MKKRKRRTPEELLQRNELMLSKLISTKNCPNQATLVKALKHTRWAQNNTDQRTQRLLVTTGNHLIQLTRMRLRYDRMRKAGKIDKMPFFER
jgi:hypothetical protein